MKPFIPIHFATRFLAGLLPMAWLVAATAAETDSRQIQIQSGGHRTIQFPPGTWKGDDGSRVEGPAQVTVEASLDRLPWYRKTQ
jgi:hypothetical protein